MPSGLGETSERTRSPVGRIPRDADDSASAGHDVVDAHQMASVRSAVRTQGGVLRIVQGAKRVGLAVYELQRAALQLVDVVGKPPYAVTDSLDSLEGLKLGEGVVYRVLYDRSALAHPAQLEVTAGMVALGERARVIPTAPVKLMIVDNAVALLPLTVSEHAVETAVVIRSSEMLASVKRIFGGLWRSAASFTPAAESRGDEVRPSEQERWILSLLASGATDDAIGRLMGLSARTAHRRVRELISRLGVETRFQAGMRAVQLGWL